MRALRLGDDLGSQPEEVGLLEHHRMREATVRFQHVHYRALMGDDVFGDTPMLIRLYKGHGFFDLTVWRHRWRWFW